jgi:6-phosphofructokinase 1
MAGRVWPKNQNFVGEDEEVVTTQIVKTRSGKVVAPKAYCSAGPCEKLYWDPRTVKACVVTCGGLCPGLNTVVREIVNACHNVYGVPR